ncbi:uncharacterized protein VP01_2736g5 [Puccinia sorghi]|uniref:Uncharacterized protein n=1 Tax=Puccinia sorghi TaxID=27349 RepID=A0A0L6V3W1_9BASI|nr:uncharacterized protein VP01_2736g5 [Puccinia sorghi]
MVKPPQCELVLSSLILVSAGQPSPLCQIWTDVEIVDAICRAGPADLDYNWLRDLVMSPGPQRSNPKLAKYSVENGLLFHGHRIVVPQDSALRREIICSHHDSKLAGVTGCQSHSLLVRLNALFD